MSASTWAIPAAGVIGAAITAMVGSAAPRRTAATDALESALAAQGKLIDEIRDAKDRDRAELTRRIETLESDFADCEQGRTQLQAEVQELRREVDELRVT